MQIFRLLQLLTFIIVTLIYHSRNEYIAATITPTSYIISQFTSYIFVIYRNNNPVTSQFISPIASVPSTVFIQLNLPTDYSRFSNSTTLNCFNTATGVTLSCTANFLTNIITISNFFNSPGTQTAQILSITINLIRNPSRAIATANFQYYIKHQNGTIIDQSPSATSGVYSTSITFQPASFSSCAISANNNFILTRSRLTFTITATNAIPADGQLIINIPLTWDGDLDQSNTITSTPTCTSISGISNPTCTYIILNSPINIARITMSTFSTSGIAAGSQFIVDISSILTPPYTNYNSQIQIYSSWSDGIFIDSCIVKINNIVPIPFRSVNFNVQSGTTVVQSKFIAKLDLILSRAFSSQDQISLFLPNNFLTNNAISITSSTFAIFTTTVQLLANNTGTTQVILSNFPSAPSILPANNIFTLFLNNISNFDSIQPQTITITFYRRSQTYQSSSTSYAATIGTFNNFNIISDNIAVNNIGNSLVTVDSQFKITPGSYIQIIYNSAINAADINNTNITYSALNGVRVNNVNYITFQSVIRVSNLFQTQFNSGIIQVRIPSFMNPPTVRPTAFTLTIKSNTNYPIATAVYTYTAALQAFKSGTVTLTASSYRVMDTSVTYTLQFQTFYGYTSISILIPPQISTNTGFQITCSPNTYSSCTINTITQTGYSNLTFIGSASAGIQTLSWGNNINPNSFKPTSSFSLFTYLTGWGVQKSTGFIILTMGQQASLLLSQVVPSSYTNNANIRLQISYILPARTPSGIITITIPSIIDITNAVCTGTNIGTCTLMTQKITIIFTSTSTNSTYSSSVVLTNVINAPSFKPVPNFLFTLITTDNYQSITNTMSAWTNIQVSTFNTEVTSNIGFRGQNALFTFIITGLSGKQTFVNININVNFGALNSSTIPNGATLVSSYQVRFSISGLGTAQLLLTLQTPIYLGNYSFSLTTYTNDQFIIGSSTYNNWQHSCSGTQCKQCNGNLCRSCYNSTLTQFYILNIADSTCIRACSVDFYLDNFNNCIPCNTNCLQCVNSSTYCTSCPIFTNTTPSTVYYLNTIFNTCVLQCSTTYYANSITQRCDRCVQPCFTCTSQFVCLTCVDGFYLLAITSACVTTCPANFMVPNNVNKTCNFCSTNCLTCSIFTFNCTSCNNTQGLYLNGNVCVSNCSNQKFLVDNICTQCQSPCRICFNSTTICSACFPNSSYPLWFDFKCISNSQCVIGHYINSVNGSCDPCPTQCQQCTSLTNCSACSTGFYLFAHSCISTCPNITYRNNSTLTCDTCVGCVTCTSVNTCTSCRSIQFFYLSVCYSLCPNGTYSSSQISPFTNINRTICVACPIQCPTCLNDTYCLTCVSQQYLYKGVCNTTCPISTFPSSPQCINCPQTCETCTTSTNCLTCDTNYSLQNSVCVLRCSKGISFQQVCYPCGLNCALCQNTTCLRCSPFYYLLNNVCMSQCSANTLTLDNMTCTACSNNFINCSTCSQTACLSCLDGQLKNGQCLPCIPSKYSHNSMCVNCPIVCAICTGPTYCTSCASGYYEQSNFCVDTCPNNKIPNGTKCDICIVNCSTCNLQTRLCSICNAGMYQFEGYCVQVCPQSYVKNLNKTLCVTQEQYSQQYSVASKPIYFPFTIAVVVAIIIGIILNCYIKTMHLVTFLVSIIGWVQLACWILFGIIQYLFYTNLQTNALRGVILVFAALITLIISNFVFLRFYYKYFVSDMDFIRWERRHCCINMVFVVLASLFSFKVHRIIYSKVLQRDQLSLVLSSAKKLIPVSVLSVISIFVSSAPVIVGTSFAIYYSLNQDQQFFNALDTLIVTGIMIILMILDLKHKHSYFIDQLQTQNIRNKVYHEDYQQFSINNKKSDKYIADDYQKGSNISRQNLVEGADSSNLLDHMTTAKKFKINKIKRQQLQQGAQFNLTLRDNNKLAKNKKLQELQQSNNALKPQQQEYKEQSLDQLQQIPSKNHWIQKQYDHHGYLIKRDEFNNIIKYDKNGYKIIINQKGQHQKYDQNGYLIKIDPNTGEHIKYDKDRYRVSADGTRYDVQTGYRVEKTINQKGQNVIKMYDQHGYQVIKDQHTNQYIKIDKKGNKVIIDTVTKKHKVYNRQGYQILYGNNGQPDKYLNQQGQYVRYNTKKNKWQQYDPTDGFLFKKNNQTGQYQKYDQYGFRIQKDQFGNIYRYDQYGNRIIFGLDGQIRRFDKQGYQIKRDPITGTEKKYDKQGYQVRINPQTKQKIFYDQNGFIIQRDFYGNITRYDEQGNTVVIDPETKKVRKFNNQGFQITQDGKGGTYLKDKRGRKVVDLQQGYYQKYDEEGNKIWLDEQGYQVETDQHGNIIKYDKLGDPVSQDYEQQNNQDWKIQENKGDNLVIAQKNKTNKKNKFTASKQFNFQQEYSKMLMQENKPKLLFDFEDQLQDTDNLKQFHDIEPVKQYQLQKEYQTLYNDEAAKQYIRRQKSQGKLKINLQQLGEIDHTPYINLKERVKKSNRQSNLNKKGDQDSFNESQIMMQPQTNQQKLQLKSVADVSISQRSFINEGVKPLTDQSRNQQEDMQSLEQVDANLAHMNKNNKSRRSDANFDKISHKNQTRSENNFLKTNSNGNGSNRTKSKIKDQIGHKIYNSDQQVQSLGEEQWQNQQVDIIYKDNHNSNANTNTHYQGNQQQQPSDILSDYIPQQPIQEQNERHKASEQNLLHKRYMQSIEEVQDELFEKLKSQDHKVKRTQFKLSGKPNPLVQYAKTIDAKRMQDQMQKGKKDRYFNSRNRR